jgi:hypothetical protein
VGLPAAGLCLCGVDDRRYPPFRLDQGSIDIEGPSRPHCAIDTAR